MMKATRAGGAIAAVCLLAATACSSDGDETTSESAPTAAPATAVEDAGDEPTTTEPPETTPSTAAPTTAPPATSDESRPWEEGLETMFPAGVARLPILGGVQFELDQDRPIIQLDSVYAGIRHEDDPQVVGPETGLAVVTGTSSGDPITTTDELVAALVDHVGLELTPIGDVATAIGPAQGYEYTYDQEISTVADSNALPHLLYNSNWIYAPEPVGQIWIVDTERGPFMVSAHADSQGPGLDEAITTLDRVLETIVLIELEV